MIGHLDEEMPDESWQKAIRKRTIELTCGEAPFIVSRYDPETGQYLLIQDRYGVLDNKFKIAKTYINDEKNWVRWAYTALRTTYGYEFQGDSLFLARENVLFSFIEYMVEYWGHGPTVRQLAKAAEIISWNLFQADGLTKCPPYKAEIRPVARQLTLFEESETMQDEEGLIEEVMKVDEGVDCVFTDWKMVEDQASVYRFRDISSRKEEKMKKFDVCIGNPPFQDETIGDNDTYAPPIYHKFMEGAYEIADVVELIHPARFLFNAGSTEKTFNAKMLIDPHFKVLHYEPDSKRIFGGKVIKGGIAITYRDESKEYGAIRVYTPYPELGRIFKKVTSSRGFFPFSNIITTSYAYHFLPSLYENKPELKGIASKGHEYDLKSNVFEKMPGAFLEKKPSESDGIIRILGRTKAGRTYRYIERKYINEVENLDSYKVFIPRAFGTGEFGEKTPEVVYGNPGDGSTETFMSIGKFDNEQASNHAAKYIKTKFARTLLGVLKKTQDNTVGKWDFVPLQDFSNTSDIDWTQPIPGIDKQLYRKYGLTDEEIEFIESHVKEMK